MRYVTAVFLIISINSSSYAMGEECIQTGVPHKYCYCLNGKCVDLRDPGIYP